MSNRGEKKEEAEKITGYSEEEIWERLWDKYAVMLYRIALHEMRNCSDAEDVRQEVFLRLLKEQGKLLSQSYLEAWLVRVTKNCCRTEVNCAYRKHTILLQEEQQNQGDAQIEGEWIKKEDGSDIREEIRKLNENQRRCIWLFYYEQYSIREIGDLLRVEVGTVKSWLFRARQTLKSTLKYSTL
ncbi:MAG: sigma-70 family RNA polymerase sigma factor [Lachnospiraceae bacterium]|nr:sigma-70 family RNA polymerase sigma factor [Lachnospiraceae bacterium]